MQRDDTERRREPRRKTQGNEAQDPDVTPSFLTARELQAWDPAKSAERRAVAADRRRSADAPRTVHKQD